MTLKDTCKLIIEKRQMMKWKNQPIDIVTAKAILEVCNSLSLESQAKIDKIPFPKFLEFVWRCYE